eukprot:SAG31_NODE_6332_length_2062_cov_1.602649_3_plen_53_part_00
MIARHARACDSDDMMMMMTAPAPPRPGGVRPWESRNLQVFQRRAREVYLSIS